MSRLDKFEEILNSYEGRKYDSKNYRLSDEDIKKIHERMTDINNCTDDTKKLMYIWCKHGKYADVTHIKELEDIQTLLEQHMQARIKNVEGWGFDFGGVLYYIADENPYDFCQQNEDLKERKHVPDGVEVNNLLVLNKEGLYIMSQGEEVKTNVL